MAVALEKICSKNEVPLSSSLTNVLDSPIIEAKKIIIQSNPEESSAPILSLTSAIEIMVIVVSIKSKIVLIEKRVRNSLRISL
jgi:hypothetical protein